MTDGVSDCDEDDTVSHDGVVVLAVVGKTRDGDCEVADDSDAADAPRPKSEHLEPGTGDGQGKGGGSANANRMPALVYAPRPYAAPKHFSSSSSSSPAQ